MKDKIFIIIIAVLLIILSLKGCGQKEITKWYTKYVPVKEIEKQTEKIKGDVVILKEIVEKEDKTQVDSLKRQLDSIMSTTNYDKDTALITCLDVVESQDIVIKRQDTIIAKQDTIISNDSIVKLMLNDEIKFQKKKARKNMWKGIGIGTGVGVIGVIFTSIVLKN